MLKNKKMLYLATAGAMILTGAIVSTGLMASAQTTSNVPVVQVSGTDSSTTVDTPKAGGTVDTDNIQSGDQQTGDHQDAGDTTIDTPKAGGTVDTDNIQSGDQQTGDHQDAGSTK